MNSRYLEQDEITNDFSWSVSRDNIFKSCLRKYYFNYYAYWGGWNSGGKYKTRELYIMKKLTARPMLIGDHVHRTTAWIIRRAKTFDSPVSIEEARYKLRKDMLFHWLTSLKHDYMTFPKEGAGIQDCYYREELTYTDFEMDYSHAEKCLQNLYASKIYTQFIKDSTAKLKMVEELDSFHLYDTNIWITSDLIYIDKDGNFEIVDWKTGKYSNENLVQLGVYALYAKEKFNIPLEKMDIREINLYNGNEIFQRVSTEHIDQSKLYIGDSISKMKSLLENPYLNEPMPIDAFTMTNNQKDCKNCNFRGRCHGIPHQTSTYPKQSDHAAFFEQKYRSMYIDNR